MPALHQPSRAGRLLAVALLVVAVVATGPGAASVTATFAESVFTQERGDVASIPIDLAGTDDATVVVEATDGTFEATLSVLDRDGDGRVTLRYNTHLARQDATRAFEATGQDDVVVRATRGDEFPVPDDYELSVAASSDADEPDDLATLLVSERSTGSIDAWAAPRSLAEELTNATTIERLRRSGPITNRSVLRDDLLVVRLQASGLEGVIAAQDGDNTTERYVDMLETERPNLTIEQSNPSPELPAKELLLNDTSTVTAVPDVRNDTYYLVVDLTQVRVDPDAYGTVDPPDHWTQVHEGEAFQAAFAFDGTPSPWNADERQDVVASRSFELVQRQAEIKTPSEFRPWLLQPEPDQNVAGRTNVHPGTSLQVVVRAPNGTFHSEKLVVVDEDGAFSTSVNLSNVPEGTVLTTDVRYENRSLVDEPTRATVDLPDPAVEIVGYDATGSYYNVDVDATLSHSGFVVLHRNDADGPTIGHSDSLSPGTHSWVSVSLDDRPAENDTIVAVVHRDADGDRSFDPGSDPLYETNGTHISDSEMIRVPDSETTTGYTTTDESTPTGERTNGQSGFEPIVAIFAILALGVARRRA